MSYSDFSSKPLGDLLSEKMCVAAKCKRFKAKLAVTHPVFHKLYLAALFELVPQYKSFPGAETSHSLNGLFHLVIYALSKKVHFRKRSTLCIYVVNSTYWINTLSSASLRSFFHIIKRPKVTVFNSRLYILFSPSVRAEMDSTHIPDPERSILNTCCKGFGTSSPL